MHITTEYFVKDKEEFVLVSESDFSTYVTEQARHHPKTFSCYTFTGTTVSSVFFSIKNERYETETVAEMHCSYDYDEIDLCLRKGIA